MTNLEPRSHSDAIAGAGGAATRVGATRVAAVVDGAVRAWEGAAAIDALAGNTATDRTRPGATVWIDLASPDAAAVARVGDLLGLHPLIVEDILEGNQRSKIEATDGLVHLVLFALVYGDEIDAHEIDVVLGKGFVLSVHPAGWEPRETHHFRAGLEGVLGPGPDHLLWALIDGIVDAYFPFADRLEDAIDELQDLVIARPDRRTLARLLGLKRQLIAVRRAVSPVREILNQLTNRELALIDADEIIYFRDIYDHTIRLTDELDTDRELVAATVDAYLSTVNNNLSLIMKRLTGVTVILAGIGAIAGIFGMSEAGAAFQGAEASGFWLVAIAVVAISVAAAVFLRRIDWI
jgi:magnesium transporter